MALPSGTDVEYIGANASGGMSLGKSTSELVSVYGVTPVDQGAAVTTVTTTGATSTTYAYGYTTDTQADAIVTAVNAIISRLQDFGIIA